MAYALNSIGGQRVRQNSKPHNNRHNNALDDLIKPTLKRMHNSLKTADLAFPIKKQTNRHLFFNKNKWKFAFGKGQKFARLGKQPAGERSY